MAENSAFTPHDLVKQTVLDILNHPRTEVRRMDVSVVTIGGYTEGPLEPVEKLDTGWRQIFLEVKPGV